MERPFVAVERGASSVGGGDGGDGGEAEAGGGIAAFRGEVALAVLGGRLGAGVVEDDDEAAIEDARLELEERLRRQLVGRSLR